MSGPRTIDQLRVEGRKRFNSHDIYQHMATPDRLYNDVIDMCLKRTREDIGALLSLAEEATTIGDKIEYIDRGIKLLQDLRDSIQPERSSKPER